MPIMNGVETTLALRKLHSTKEIDLTKTKIIMHSAIQ